MVRELGAISIESAWMGVCRPLRRRDQIGGFSTVGVEVAYDLLGGFLLDAIDEPSMNVEQLRLGFPNMRVTRVGLARLIAELGWHELADLRTLSPPCAPIIVHAVQRAVNAEVAQRRWAEERTLAARWRPQTWGGPRESRAKARRGALSAKPAIPSHERRPQSIGA